MKPIYPPCITTLPLKHQGKVRDTFEIPGHPDLLLVAATDRISTHNVVHESAVLRKGQFLTAMTVFWTQEILQDTPHHIIAYGKDIYLYLPKDGMYPADLHLYAIVVTKLDMIPFELIFRAYMTGSLWSEFYSQGLSNPYGIKLPEGLRLMDTLDPVAFTPTDKSETDEPVNAKGISDYYHVAVTAALDAYNRCREYARSRGIEIIDTKLEFGTDNSGRVVMGDEFFTPDNSRFSALSSIQVGQNPPWMDKEVFRQDAMQQWGSGKQKPPLRFSDDVIEAGMAGYAQLFLTLTGLSLEDFQRQYFE